MKPGEINVEIRDVSLAKMPEAAWHEPKFRKLLLNKLAAVIQFMLPKGRLFALVIFDDDVQEGTFVSNASREGCIAGVREFADKYDRGEVWSFDTEGQS